MNYQLLILVFIAFAWFIRLEIKIHNLEIGKRYVLYDERLRVSHISSDGALCYSLKGNLFTYRTALGIQKLYPELKIINAQTGMEVTKCN